MKESAAALYRCPYTNEPLQLADVQSADGEVTSGRLVAPSGRSYAVRDGIPYLIDESLEKRSDEEERELQYYESSASAYDTGMDWLFRSFYENEEELRQSMVASLALQPSSTVLEIGCGTARDSIYIARELGAEGRMFLQDLSPQMLTLGRRRMQQQNHAAALEYFVGNAASLPFPERMFDAVFHFGALNVFSDRAKALHEIARVTKVGGKVVLGDEGLGPWLRTTDYGRILENAHPLYRADPPVELLPPNARNVAVRWLLGNAFYLLEFTIGDGPPPVDLDLPIPGRRGGTLRTRWMGMLEGVTPETRQKAAEAAARDGVSLHEWLERVVSTAAKRQD
ncbi:MAG: class I SAM-dependent methyltransferase [Acidobacteriota bacterium]|nr:class I SAM-dependent methyltransferase [Acidobacteriota bacterium]